MLQDPVVYSSVYASFMQGGYYAINITSEIVLISVNGIYPFSSNGIQQANGTTLMLDWMQGVLEANKNKKFMTEAHVFPGSNYYEGSL